MREGGGRKKEQDRGEREFHTIVKILVKNEFYMYHSKNL